MVSSILGAKKVRRFATFSIGGGTVLGFLWLGLAIGLQHSDESAPCGETCHDVMEPQYTTYKASAHARVRCVSCHVGPSLGDYVEGKVILIQQGLRTITGNYPTPIRSPLRRLRPSQDTCERCHWPEKFYDNRLREIRRYDEDERNTEHKTLLMMKTGSPKGGNADRTIHWHIQSEILYIAADLGQQNIPWVGVRDKDGRLTEYLSTESSLSPEQIGKATKIRADCLLCHNRATHVFSTPDRAMDMALAEARIDPTLPYIKKKGKELLTAPYRDKEEALRGIATLNSYYQGNYPVVYSTKGEEIGRAVTAIQEIYQGNVFPKMGVTWATYPNNLGHSGCFRCHDGKHATADGRKIGSACNSCHDILPSLPGGK